MRIRFCDVPLGGTITPVRPPWYLWMKTENAIHAGQTVNAVRICLSHDEPGQGSFRQFHNEDIVQYSPLSKY